MPLFSRKPKVPVEEFLRDFYDKQILHANIGGVDAFGTLIETYYSTLLDMDQNFATVDAALFKREMTALRFELVGLAWLQRFQRNKYLVPEIRFTRSYLEAQPEYVWIWDAMGPFNKAIAQSVLDVMTGERARRGNIAFTNSFRMNMFEKWTGMGLDAECAARLGNRIASDVAWSRGHTPRHLCATLLERLNYEPTPQAVLNQVGYWLQVAIIGFYDGAKFGFSKVQIVA